MSAVPKNARPNIAVFKETKISKGDGTSSCLPYGHPFGIWLQLMTDYFHERKRMGEGRIAIAKAKANLFLFQTAS